jgi:hypothetical protein
MTVSSFIESPPKNEKLKLRLAGLKIAFLAILKNLPVQTIFRFFFVPGDFLRFRQKRDYKSRPTKFKFFVFLGTLNKTGNCHTVTKHTVRHRGMETG